MYPPFRRDRIDEYATARRDPAQRRGALLVTFARGGARRIDAPPRASTRWTRRCPLDPAPRRRPRSPTASDAPALIQYTSGSTGDPKGVLLSHANILANIRAIGQAIASARTTSRVSWLPLYHDMGLIGSWLGSDAFGLPVSVMSPLTFLRARRAGSGDPRAPRHALGRAELRFDLCVSKIADDEIEGLDLSSWRLA